MQYFKRLSDYSLLLRCLPGYSQNVNESLNSLIWNRGPKHRYKGPLAIETAVMSAILAFNSGTGSRQAVMNAANIPGGEFTLAGCAKKDQNRMPHSVRKAQAKEKERRRKIRQAKLSVTQEKEGKSYARGMFNEVDPLACVECDDDDDYPLARLFDYDESEDSDDAPLAQSIAKK